MFRPTGNTWKEAPARISMLYNSFKIQNGIVAFTVQAQMPHDEGKFLVIFDHRPAVYKAALEYMGIHKKEDDYLYLQALNEAISENADVYVTVKSGDYYNFLCINLNECRHPDPQTRFSVLRFRRDSIPSWQIMENTAIWIWRSDKIGSEIVKGHEEVVIVALTDANHRLGINLEQRLESGVVLPSYLQLSSAQVQVSLSW